MFALTLIPTTCVSVGFVHVCEDMGAMEAATKVFYTSTQTFDGNSQEPAGLLS